MTEIQQNLNEYNPQEVISALSSERLQPYRLFTPNDNEINSIVPYDLVQRLSAMLFIPLQYFEVTLRNRVYEVLKKHYTWRQKKYKELGKPEEWLSWMPKKKYTQEKIKKAYQFASKNIKDRPVHIGDIISKLSFGVWIEILMEHPLQGSPYHFWIFTQNKIFPNAKGETRETIRRELIEIKGIRNRLFHYEPIWHNDSVKNCHMGLMEILTKYEKIMKAIRWLSGDVYIFLRDCGQEYSLSEQVRSFSDALLKSFKESREENNMTV